MAWPKHLSVDGKIIRLLSASTYESFPRVLRELVSNAFDADATSVTIEISKSKKSIVILDNGTGMTAEEFDFFLRIAGQERSRSRTTVLGRERIGQFGVGFLAMFPFCKTVEVKSTVAGSTSVFVAKIPAAKFCKPRGMKDITEESVTGEEHTDRSIRSQHYTRFKLIETTPMLDRFLKQQQGGEKYRNSIRSYTGFKRLRWELQDILPLSFPKNSELAKHINPSSDFKVVVNNTQLLANDFVEDVLASSDGIEKIGDIQFRWVIGTSWKAVKPDEARGVRVRLHGVGVGNRGYFDLQVQGRTFSRLHWLAGEVNIISGLDESIALDRDTFSQSEDYEDFRNFLRDKLREQAYYVEYVDVAKKKITAQLTGSARAEIAPVDDVITKEVISLQKRGFKVRERTVSGKQSKVVDIDVKNRIVRIDKPISPQKEVVRVLGKSWNIKYARWEPESELRQKAFRVAGRTITLNQDYPLFTGSHKDVFRRIQIIIAHADAQGSTKKEFLTILQEALLDEFNKE